MKNQDITKTDVQVVEDHAQNIPIRVDSAKVEVIDERAIQDQEEFRKIAIGMGKELLFTFRDDRMVTKKNIEEAREAEHRVQEQNASAIEAYKRELENLDLTAEQRMHLHDMINQRTESSQKVHEDTEQTVKRESDHLHEAPKKVVTIVGIGGGAAVLVWLIRKLAA